MDSLIEKVPKEIVTMILQKKYGGNNERAVLINYIISEQSELIQPFFDKKWNVLDEWDGNYWY